MQRMTMVSDAREIHGELVEFRRAMHRHPEIGLQLPSTQERVLAALDPLGLEISTGEALTSVTGVLRGGARDDANPRAVLLRADMDALPVQELTGVDYTSQVDGAMHACGHDLHTAMLIGAARLLHARRDELPGDVVFMFQPGEEGDHGGRFMVDEGVLDAAGPRVEAAYGMHVFSAMNPGGTFVTKPGPMLAAADEFEFTVKGRGGHGSTPVMAMDPVPIGAEIITAANVAVTRQFSVFDPVVVTFGQLRAGSKSNVIPDDAFLAATVRSFSEENREKLRELLPGWPPTSPAPTAPTARSSCCPATPSPRTRRTRPSSPRRSRRNCSASSGTPAGRTRSPARRTSPTCCSRSPAASSACRRSPKARIPRPRTSTTPPEPRSTTRSSPTAPPSTPNWPFAACNADPQPIPTAR